LGGGFGGTIIGYLFEQFVERNYVERADGRLGFGTRDFDKCVDQFAETADFARQMPGRMLTVLRGLLKLRGEAEAGQWRSQLMRDILQSPQEQLRQ
jgi:hypothetical protein